MSEFNARELLASIRQGDAQALTAALDAGCSPDTVCDARTLLQHAMLRRAEPIVLLLIGRGANVNLVQGDERTVAHMVLERGASQLQSPTLLPTLLAAGANTEARGPGGRTLLHQACVTGTPAQVDMLLRHGALPSSQDSAGRTPLHLVVQRTLEDAVAIGLALVRAGAAVDATDPRGRTALELAVEADRSAAARALVALGASTSGMEPHDDLMEEDLALTPLQSAITIGSIPLVLHVLQQGGLSRSDLEEGMYSAENAHATELAALLRSAIARDEADQALRALDAAPP